MCQTMWLYVSRLYFESPNGRCVWQTQPQSPGSDKVNSDSFLSTNNELKWQSLTNQAAFVSSTQPNMDANPFQLNHHNPNY